MQDNNFDPLSSEELLKSDEERAEISKENEKLNRQKELTDLAHICHLKTAGELTENFFTLYQEYIKLAKPIDNIQMISKTLYPKKTFEEAITFANNFNLGNFTGWRLPTLEESKFLYKLHEVFCKPFPCNLNTWCTDDGSENYFDENSLCNNDCSERSFILVR